MSEETKKKAIKGVLWTFVEKSSSLVLQFIIGICLARVISPEEYGTIGMLAIFMAIAQSLMDSGFVRALIQKKDRDNVDYSTVFYFNLVISLVTYALFYVTSPLIADFYNTPILKDVTRVVALTLLINALTIVQTAKLTIELNFRLQTIATVTSSSISGAVGIYMAYTGWGVWALVWQGVIGAVVRLFVLWIFSRWRPLFIFSKSSFKKLFSFGSKLLIGDFLHTIASNLYTLVIGKALNVSDVGYYNRADGYAVLPTNVFGQVVNKVIFPILSKYQDDDSKLVSTYRKMVNVPMSLYVPFMFGFAALAKPLIVVMITDKWLTCVPFIQVLCIGYIISPMNPINLNLLYVKGRSDLSLKLDLIKKPLMVALLFATIPFDVLWVCVGKAVYEFLAFSLNCYYTKKILNYGLPQQLRDLLPIFLSSAIMVCAIVLVTRFFLSDWLQLIIGFVVGVISYCFVAKILKVEGLKEVAAMVGEIISQKNK